MNRGGAGARSLNIELQAALNPAGERKVERFGRTFAPGDKVMQIENDCDKEVYNGDIGAVVEVDLEAGEPAARFEGRGRLYGFGEFDALVPAYAATVHKSQGYEYSAVVIPVLTQQYAMPKRNLLLYQGHAGQAAGGAAGPEKGSCHRGAQCVRTPAAVEAGRFGDRRERRHGIRNRPRCAVSSEAVVDRGHALPVIGERHRTGRWGRRTVEQDGDGRSVGSPNRPEQVGGQRGARRCVRCHRGRTCQWRGSPDRRIRDLRHQKPVGPHRTQPEDGSGGFDSGVDVAHIQGGEDVQGCRLCTSRVVTLQRQPTAPGDDSGSLHVEFSRLLCDDRHSASRKEGASTTRDSRGLGLDAGGRFVLTIAFRWGCCSLHPLRWDAAVRLEDDRNTRIVLRVIKSMTAPRWFFPRVVVRQ